MVMMMMLMMMLRMAVVPMVVITMFLVLMRLVAMVVATTMPMAMRSGNATWCVAERTSIPPYHLGRGGRIEWTDDADGKAGMM
eukprot:2102594-Pyramimonas_sp.AAC.2